MIKTWKEIRRLEWATLQENMQSDEKGTEAQIQDIVTRCRNRECSLSNLFYTAMRTGRLHPDWRPIVDASIDDDCMEKHLRQLSQAEINNMFVVLDWMRVPELPVATDEFMNFARLLVHKKTNFNEAVMRWEQLNSQREAASLEILKLSREMEEITILKEEGLRELEHLQLKWAQLPERLLMPEQERE